MPPSTVSNHAALPRRKFNLKIKFARKAEPLPLPSYFDGKGNALPRRKFSLKIKFARMADIGKEVFLKNFRKAAYYCAAFSFCHTPCGQRSPWKPQC